MPWTPTPASRDFGIGYAVAGGERKIAGQGLEFAEVAGGKALMATVQGEYSQLGNAHSNIGRYCAANQLKPAMPVIEEYVVSPIDKPEAKDWQTHLYWLYQ